MSDQPPPLSDQPPPRARGLQIGLALILLAAAAEYKAAQIPALTSQAAADALTLGNSWCFRAATPSLAQAQWLASYIRNIFQGHSSPLARAADIDLVVSNDAYGLSFSRGYFAGSEGQSLKVWTADKDPKGAAASVGTIADSLAREPEPRIILIAVQGGGANSVDLVKAAFAR
jgi:hypothetical protein